MKVELPFAAQVGKSGIKLNSQERLLNMYAAQEVSGIKKVVRLSRPGLVLKHKLVGEKRGVIKVNSVHYVVAGAQVWQLVENGTLTQIGVLSTSTGRCTLAANNSGQVAICDGESLWAWSKPNGFQRVSAPDFNGFGSISYLDGFGIFHDPETGQFGASALNNFSDTSNGFASAESKPDNITRIYVDHREIWIFGKESIEIWYNAGTSPFPFARVSSAPMERGCLAPDSIASGDNTVFWLGDDKMVYRARGYTPEIISTPSVASLINDVVNPENAVSFVYTWNNHKFYVLTFPGALTIVYDIATGLWHEANTWEQKDWQTLGAVNGQSDFILTQDGFCVLDDEEGTDNGVRIDREAISAPFRVDGDWIEASSFRIDADVGTAGQSEEPEVMLSVARDGRAFGNERWRTLGKIGERRHRTTWRVLGTSREFVLKIRYVEKTPFHVISTYADVHQSA